MPTNVEVNLHGGGFRCHHWATMTKEVERWLRQRELVAVVHLNLPSRGEVVAPDGRIHVLLGSSVRDGENVPGADADNVTILPGQGKIGFQGLPDCPEERDVSRVIDTLERIYPLIVPDSAMAERARAEVLARNREEWVEACSARFEKTIAECKNAIASGESEVERLQKTLTRRIRELNGQRRKLAQLSADGHEAEREKYGREYDKLVDLPKVERVEVADGVVRVFTSVLLCRDDRDNAMHEIGAFRVDLIMAGDVRWYNQTRKGPDDHHAPHIGPDGRACFGNTAEIWPELLANYEFAAAAMVAIQFIESANTDDSWGRLISEWPLATTENAGEGVAQ